MAYTPELTMEDSAALRRIAWSIGKPMTKALHEIIHLAVGKRDYCKICSKCKDRNCENCIFKGKP